MDDLEIPFGPLDAVCADIRGRAGPEWRSLFESQLITADEMSVLSDLTTNRGEPSSWNEIFNKDNGGSSHVLPLFAIFERLSQEGGDQREVCIYLLVLLYDLILAHPKMFKAAVSSMPTFTPLTNLLVASLKDEIIEIQAARVLTLLGRLLGDLPCLEDALGLFGWIEQGLKGVGERESRAVVASLILQHALRADGLKAKFNKSPTLFISLLDASRRTKNSQIQYQCLFSIWLLSFLSRLINEYHMYDFIPVQMEIVKTNCKEKLLRICMATWKNLISKAKAHTIPVMIGAKLLDYLELLLSRGINDEEVHADAILIRDELNKAYHSLNSFDEYASEVKSGMLEWSPPHKSSLFWHDNAARLEEGNCELLRLLTKILATSQDPLVLSVAANDVGQYIQVRPHGKSNLERLGTKEQLMMLMSHADADVRFNALTAVQTYMSNLWKSV